MYNDITVDRKSGTARATMLVTRAGYKADVFEKQVIMRLPLGHSLTYSTQYVKIEST